MQILTDLLEELIPLEQSERLQEQETTIDTLADLMSLEEMEALALLEAKKTIDHG